MAASEALRVKFRTVHRPPANATRLFNLVDKGSQGPIGRAGRINLRAIFSPSVANEWEQFYLTGVLNASKALRKETIATYGMTVGQEMLRL